MVDLEELLKKYLKGLCNEEEKEALLKWFHEFESNSNLHLSEEDFLEAKRKFKSPFPINDDRNKISVFRPYWIKWVASILVVISAGLGINYLNHEQSEQTLVKQAERENISISAPTLIVENGKVIDLHSVKGVIDTAKAVDVQVLSNHQLEYNRRDNNYSASDENIFHTLKTPRKYAYTIKLEDGTVVHLNAMSSLKFPTSFKNLDAREVELEGEAFFEVNKNYVDEERKVNKPFIVHTKNQVVEVLGTVFNISAYADNGFTTTTLVHGKVKVRKNKPDARGGELLLVSSGEQGMLSGDSFVKKKVDIREETAWREGKFVFNDQDLYSIMKIIARWYPIRVEFKADFKHELFGGTLSKNKSLEEILTLLETTGEVKFKLEKSQGNEQERRVLVMK